MKEEFTPQQEYVFNTVNNRDVHFLRLWFSDVFGNLKSLAIVPNELQRAFEIGIPIDGGLIYNVENELEQDIVIWPDATSFQILPWRPDEKCVARMFCNVKTPDGASFSSDTRHILQKTLERASSLGYSIHIKPEIEFYYFVDSESPIPIDEGSSFDLTTLDSASDLRRDTILTLEAIGIPVEKSYHEAGPSQNEIDLRTQDALSMADSILSYKAAVKEIARAHGVFASFMPKPLNDLPGSGMTLQIHLENEKSSNVFYDEKKKDAYCLSKIGENFMAGILKHAREFCLLTNQYSNSYKRLCSNGFCARTIAWSSQNKNTMLRLSTKRENCDSLSRIILRNPDPTCNPYLAFAGIIASGIQGIEENLELSSPVEDFSKLNRDKENLPETLGEAIDEFEGSELMRETLGDDVFNFIVKTKRSEWKEAISVVDNFEINQYLAVL